MARLDGKVAIITGGASGMGAATVRRFRSEGAHVIVTDLKRELGQEVANSCGAEFFAQDVSDEASWNELADLISRRYGHLDVLMNNAGIWLGGSIGEVDMATWNKVMSVNLTSVMLGCRTAVKLMSGPSEASKGGSIINISSTAAYAGVADDVAYSASKSGVRMLTKSVAIWCAREGLKIRCNSIHPGPIITSIHDEARRKATDPSEIDHFLDSLSPLGHAGTGDDIAATALFLASDESAFVTGAELLVDGGMMARHPGL